MTKVLPITTRIRWNLMSRNKKAEVLKANLAKLGGMFPELKNIP